MATVPCPAHPGGLSVAGVHAQGRLALSGGVVARGQAQAQRGAQVVQAAPGHPLPALVGFLAVGRQDEGVIPHPQAPVSALVVERKVVGVQRLCAGRGETAVNNADRKPGSMLAANTAEQVRTWINRSIN